MRRTTFFMIAAALLAAALLLAPAPFDTESSLALGWSRLAGGGFIDADNSGVGSLGLYSGSMFAGTGNEADGCEVFSYNGSAWMRVAGGGFGDAENIEASSMSSYGGRLMVGTGRLTDSCQVWSYDGSGWTQEVGQGPEGDPTGPGFGDPGNIEVSCMAVYRGKLYAGTYNPDGCQVWSFDGSTWSMAAEEGFGDGDNYEASSMAVYGSRLYVGTYDNSWSKGCQVWSFDGSGWAQEVGQGPEEDPTGPGFGSVDNRTAASMAVYGARLYVGTQDSSGGYGCEIWSYDGEEWRKSSGGGFGDRRNFVAECMAADGLDLFVGTNNQTNGCEIWRYDGTTWTQENADGFGYSYNTVAASALLDEGYLYVGTADPFSSMGCEIWSSEVCRQLYFAEGYTGQGFQEYLCLGNPNACEARTAVTYLFAQGDSLTRQAVIPAESRETINVNGEVGEGREVSVKVESDCLLLAERPMYFTYEGSWSGGHDCLGTDRSSTRWFFAEGYTGPGFEQWVCVLNPREGKAELTFHFQTQEEGEVLCGGYEVPAHSRRSFKINEVLGENYQNSLELESSLPVVAERPMYFDYLGMGEHHWQGGHCVMGIDALRQEYYLAEGTTRGGFEEWLTLQNPHAFDVEVNAEYQFAAGQGEPLLASYEIAAGERYTAYVPGEVGPEKDVSVKLFSTSTFLAERPMYFSYSGYGTGLPGGHCVIGAARPATGWFFAEGYTGTGFHTWLCLQNPGPDEAEVEITYYTQEQGPLEPEEIVLPPGSRETVYVNQSAGADYQLSIGVRSDRPVVAERPMYFYYGGGVPGGHDVVGYPYG